MAVAAQQTFQQLTTAGLDQIDPEIAELLGRELERQRGQIELIASENFTWPAVLEVGACQADDVSATLASLGYVDVRVTPDLAGIDRVVEGRRP